MNMQDPSLVVDTTARVLADYTTIGKLPYVHTCARTRTYACALNQWIQTKIEKHVTVHLIHHDHVNRITDVDGAAEALVAAKSVVIVPGYGLGESFLRIHETIYVFDLFMIFIILVLGMYL